MSDEEQFAVFLKNLDFSEISNSNQFSSLEQLQKELFPKIPKKSENPALIEAKAINSTVSKMSESLGHMENLLMFIKDFLSKENKKFGVESVFPSFSRGLTPSESFKLYTLKQKVLILIFFFSFFKDI